MKCKYILDSALLQKIVIESMPTLDIIPNYNKQNDNIKTYRQHNINPAVLSLNLNHMVHISHLELISRYKK